MSETKHLLAVGIALIIGVAPLSQASAASRPRTEVEKAMGKCAAGILVGALAGAVIGNNSGDGDAKRGAAIGAVAGVGFCAVLMTMANERDKRQIADAQAMAAQDGIAQRRQYVGNDGLKRTVAVSSEDIYDNSLSASPRLCRRLNTTLEVEGKGSAVVPNEVVCRQDDGSWLKTAMPTT